MSKIRLTVSDGKVIDYLEAPDQAVKREFYSFNSLQDLQVFLSSGKTQLPNGAKIALSHEDGVIEEVAVVSENNKDPIEYIFDNDDQAEKFISSQGYKPSIHMMPANIQDSVSGFFSNSDCDFQDCEELKEKYEQEISEAGGTDCPDCTRNAIMRKYQDLILEQLENSKNQ